MQIKKTKLRHLDFMAPNVTAWVDQDKGYIFIQRKWLFGDTEDSIKLSALDEVEVEQMGLWRMIFNYGTLILKASGGVREELKWVKNPHYYRSIIEG